MEESEKTWLTYFYLPSQSDKRVDEDTSFSPLGEMGMMTDNP
jgi:hypothetical protein